MVQVKNIFADDMEARLFLVFCSIVQWKSIGRVT